MIEGRGLLKSLKFVSHRACLLSPVESEIYNVHAVWIGKITAKALTHSIQEFNPLNVRLKG